MLALAFRVGESLRAAIAPLASLGLLWLGTDGARFEALNCLTRKFSVLSLFFVLGLVR